MSPTTRYLLLLAPLAPLAACKPDCAENEVSNKHGYDCTPVPGWETGSSEAATTDTTAETTEDPSTSTTDDTSTGTPPPCDDDPACGPGETPQTCPAQCGTCGDGQRTGDELCDDGDANQTYWPTTPPQGACSETCTFALEFCGDAKQNGDEPCDNGTNNDAPYSPTTPPQGACAPGCTAVAYCGDAIQNGDEPCDTAGQSATCELDCTLPTCGDGTLNRAANETCDDHNTQDGDGCTADCQSLERFVFVTSASFKGDLNNEDPEQSANPDGLTGLALADYRCQTLATKAALPGTYKAWLSTNTESPSTRFDKSFTGLYRLPGNDFPIVASGWNALTSAPLAHPINANETAKLTADNVFTNTLPDGSSASDLDCTDWSMKGNTATTIGQSSAIDDTWTRIELSGICSGSNRLYCFQDP